MLSKYLIYIETDAEVLEVKVERDLTVVFGPAYHETLTWQKMARAVKALEARALMAEAEIAGTVVPRSQIEMNLRPEIEGEWVGGEGA